MNHKEKRKIYNLKYRFERKTFIADCKRKFYVKNKAVQLAKSSVRIICACGSEIRKHGLSRHLKTKQHDNLMNILELYFLSFGHINN